MSELPTKDRHTPELLFVHMVFRKLLQIIAFQISSNNQTTAL
jgi:hypothetical protein